MDIFPAIDLIGGKVVRLFKGDYGAVKTYELTPKEAAISFMEAGARHIHVVDLDGAKSGKAENTQAVKDIIAATKAYVTGGAFVEIGGGIRTEEQIKSYLEAGAGRVILGTVAVKDFAFTQAMVQKYKERIAVGVDAVNHKVAVSGWREVTDENDYDFCFRLRDIGVQTVIYTDISTDGTMQGTNLSAYETLTKIQGLNITASGGISSVQEIVTLKKLGVKAAILGKAMYEGKLALKDAVAAGEGVC
jgi:phosphoribosylformimino-5-aminoimidazole carboxamide ribotide isomerase